MSGSNLSGMTNTHPSTRHSTEITVIGLGPMGLALAEALLRANRSLTVWNRTAAKADGLVRRGARPAPTAADAVAASPVTVACLSDYPAVDGILDLLGPLDGHTLVNLSSGTPAEARATADRAAGLGLDYLDGAVMVPPPLVGHDGSVLLYDGPREVLDRHREILTDLGEPRHLGAEPGLAVLHNAAMLGMMYATLNGFLHAAALVGSANVPVTDFAELALGWFMPVVLSPDGIAEQAPHLDAGHYPGDLGGMGMNLNALEHITRTSEEQGVHSEQPRMLARVAERAIARGHGADNYFAVFEVLRKPDPDVL